MKKKAALHNLGCKVNAYETEAMQQILEQAGYEIVPFAPGADVYVINTCTVTNIADRKSRQMLHKAKKMNPRAVVVAAGCYVQAAGAELQADDAIDIVIGNNRKKDLARILEEYEMSRETPGCAANNRFVTDIGRDGEYESLDITRTAGHTRAYLKVQDGCNQFCSYCIIPYARGRVRSRRAEDVLAEVRRLAENGYQEIVLTGIHLSSYGIDRGTSLLSLIRAVHETEGIRRIRLGSLEPGIVTEEFVQTIASLPKICPHFHLSLQSGCDATLKRMNRRYTSEEYFEKCLLLRDNFKNPALTTDVIVGFPGETEEEFAQTRAFLEKVRFYETHVFKYSRRKGTRAAVMENQVDDGKKTERSNILLELSRENQAAYENERIGKNDEALFEEPADLDGGKYFTGHTREYVKLAIPATEDFTNRIVQVSVKNERRQGILLCGKF